MGGWSGVNGRPTFGPPEALALHVPDEIVLSYAQVQGLKGAEAFISASGRALLWAYTSPSFRLSIAPSAIPRCPKAMLSCSRSCWQTPVVIPVFQGER